MNKLSLIIVLIGAVCAFASETDSQGTFNNLFCQVEFVKKEKLLDVQNVENTFEILVDDPKKVNCDEILAAEKERIYKDLRERQDENTTIDCNIKKLRELNFHKLRYKVNSLLGLSLPIPKKNELRTKINKEIENAISESVDVC